jgi:hypothetical protein
VQRRVGILSQRSFFQNTKGFLYRDHLDPQPSPIVSRAFGFDAAHDPNYPSYFSIAFFLSQYAHQ